MSRDVDELIHGYFDETLAPTEEVELKRLIQSNPDIARRFAETALLHDGLHQVFSLPNFASSASRPSDHAFPPPTPISRWISGALAASLILAFGWMLWKFGSTPALAANGELQRVIESTASHRTRTFRMTSLDEPGREPVAVRDRGQPPSLDGALLHVRGSSEYVLERFFDDGSRFVTGSDGHTAWAIPPNGKVRVSQDPQRFRGAVPGQQHAIPFIDLRESLSQLQDTYDLSLVRETQPGTWRQLIAQRKSSARGGPRAVSIWYEPQSGAIRKIVLSGLPQARGGPRVIQMEWIADQDYSSAFFQHSSHHDPQRDVVQEESP